jgi:Zn-dependent membrane protease YugP
MFYSPGYLVVMVIGFALLGFSSMYVKRTYRRWSGIRNSTGLTGAQVAQQVLASAGLSNVRVEVVDGELSDNYDPTDKVLHLSQGVAYNASVASEAIVAHEIGHAVQDARGFAPMRLRAGVLPAANIGGQLGVTMIIIGLVLMTVLRGLSALGFNIAVLGLVLFSCVLVFQLVTLPVELDASRRAMGLLRTNGIVNQEDIHGARSVLTAAALTYVAATAYTALQVAYWGLQVFSRRD